MKFEKGEPLNIFNYLLMILNHSNAKILPSSYQNLVFDEDSEIIDLYPLEYKFELNQFLVPFFDESRIIEAVKEKEK